MFSSCITFFHFKVLPFHSHFFKSSPKTTYPTYLQLCVPTYPTYLQLCVPTYPTQLCVPTYPTYLQLCVPTYPTYLQLCVLIYYVLHNNITSFSFWIFNRMKAFYGFYCGQW